MTSQRKPLTPKQTRVVKAKLKAELNNLPQQKAAEEMFPNQTPNAAAVSMTRVLSNANVQEELARAFELHGITIEAATKPVADGLVATKTVIVRDSSAKTPEELTNSAFADQVPDHAIRLKAAGMAFNLMGVGKQTGDVTINFIGKSADQRNVYDV